MGDRVSTVRYGTQITHNEPTEGLLFSLLFEVADLAAQRG